MYSLRWYCWAILNGGRFGDLRTIYQGCRALPFALAGLSCFIFVRFAVFYCDALCVINWLIDWLIAVNGTPSHSYGTSLGIIMGSHSATCHPTQANAHRLNPSHAGRYSIYLPRRDGTLSWPSWLDMNLINNMTYTVKKHSITRLSCLGYISFVFSVFLASLLELNRVITSQFRDVYVKITAKTTQ